MSNTKMPKETGQPAQLKGLAAHVPSPSYLSLTTSFFLMSQPVHGEKKGFAAVTSPPESLFGGTGRNRETLSSPCTHPSVPGTKGPLTSKWQLDAARPTSRRPLHLSNSAQRLHWRGYRHWARNTPTFVTPKADVFGAAIPRQFSQAKRRIPVRPKDIFLSLHAQPNQGTCFHCFG